MGKASWKARCKGLGPDVEGLLPVSLQAGFVIRLRCGREIVELFVSLKQDLLHEGVRVEKLSNWKLGWIRSTRRTSLRNTSSDRPLFNPDGQQIQWPHDISYLKK
jgi:hypothetical protein